MIVDIANNFARTLGFQRRWALYHSIYTKYQDFTMINEGTYRANLQLADLVQRLPGTIVECGVWRGGMSAGMADLLGPTREYVLCDSFEGLPPVKEIDGPGAKAWQENPEGESYHDNCTAGEDFARRAMAKSSAERVRYVRGWFDQTLPTLELSEPIALLRLDGDWYDSTMTCLTHLFPKVRPGGLVVIDDYHTWDGCSRAVHDYLSAQSSVARISQWNQLVCYIKVPQS